MEDCEIVHGSAKIGGAIIMGDNGNGGGKITLKGGRIYIYDNTVIPEGANNNIQYGSSNF